MMRRRSSSRCSRKLMPVISSDARCWAFSTTGLGILARDVRSQRLFGEGSAVLFNVGCDIGYRWLRGCWKGLASDRVDGRNADRVEEPLGGQDLGWGLGLPTGPLLQLDIHHLHFELALEFIARLLELGQRLPQLPSQFGKLLRPEQDKGQQEDKNHFRHAEVHRFIIMPELSGGKPQKPPVSLRSIATPTLVGDDRGAHQVSC